MAKKPPKGMPPEDMEDDDCELFIGEWAEALGVPQKELAKAAGVKAAYMSQLCGHSKNNPKISRLMKIADRLGIPAQYLRFRPPSRGALHEIGRLDPAVVAKLQQSH